MYLDKRFGKHRSVYLNTACQTAYMMLSGHKILQWAQVCEVSPRHLSNVPFHSIWFWYCLPEGGTRLWTWSPRLVPQLSHLFFWKTGCGQGFHNLCFGLLTYYLTTEGRKRRILEVHREWSQSSHTLSAYLTALLTLPSPWPWRAL